MSRAHIIRAIREGKLSTITRSEWLDVSDVLEAAPEALTKAAVAESIATALGSAATPRTVPVSFLGSEVMSLRAERDRYAARVKLLEAQREAAIAKLRGEP